MSAPSDEDTFEAIVGLQSEKCQGSGVAWKCTCARRSGMEEGGEVSALLQARCSLGRLLLLVKDRMRERSTEGRPSNALGQ